MWAGLLSLAAPAALLAYLGTFTRLYADDYCAAWVIRSMGAWQSLVFWYTTWAGRYTSILLIGLQSLGWAAAARLLPALLLVAWLAALGWAANQALALLRPNAAPALEGSHLPLAGGAALLVVVSTFSLAPNLFQSFYWQSASAAYTYPLILLAVQAGWLLRQVRRPAGWGGVLGFALLSWLNGGFSEVFSAVQVALFGMLCLALGLLASRDLRQRLWPFAIAGLAAAALGMLVMFLAPGNQARSAANAAGEAAQGVHALAPLLALSLKYAFKTGLSLGAYGRWTFVLLAAVGCAAGWGLADQNAGRPGWKSFVMLVCLPVVCYSLVVAASAPAVYALSSDLDPRAQVIPLYFILLTVLVCAGLLGWQARAYFHRLPGWLLAAAALGLLAGMIGFSAWSAQKSLRALPDYQAQAQAWDQRDAELQRLRSSGAGSVEAPGLPSWQGLQDLRVEADFWVNDCMAKAYNLQSIRGK